MKEITSNDTIKLNELIKNYNSLKEKYIQLEKEINNNQREKDSDSLKNNYDQDDFIINENENNDIHINTNVNAKYENSDENHIILDTYHKI